MTWNLHSYTTTVLNERMWHFFFWGGCQNILTHPTYFQGVKTPTHKIYAPAWSQYQSQLLGDRGTCMWRSYSQSLLRESEVPAAIDHDLLRASPQASNEHHYTSAHAHRPRCTVSSVLAREQTFRYHRTQRKTRSSADADNRLDAFSGQSRSTNMVPFHM